MHVSAPVLRHFGRCCLPHLPAAAACGESAPSDPVWPKAPPGQSSLFCKELWRCPRSKEHTWQTVRDSYLKPKAKTKKKQHMVIKLSGEDQIAWPGLGHHGRGLVQQLGLVVRVKRSSVRHVVQNIAAYQPIPNCRQNLPEFAWQIANDAQQNKTKSAR